ncbi:hypothetical protein [Haloechinothrix sp. LS1_15]|uniref:hypothetical protein n=1 Tax=Haloechinothrix sp. LS1_15 TaxID=2652248 RepID=UPI002946DA68|nr:hypothetical protein [Haloechinothrix sp. LS1_15]MDV6014314.1 hypothetical protein [Haloechinothrix sp. LS1_15]
MTRTAAVFTAVVFAAAIPGAGATEGESATAGEGHGGPQGEQHDEVASTDGDSTTDGEPPGESGDGAEHGDMAIPMQAPGIELWVSFYVDSVSRIAGFDSELHIDTGRFDGVIREGREPGGPLEMEGDLDLPDSDGYFLAFDFMPTTSTVGFVQHGKVTGTAELDLIEQVSHVDAEAELFIVVSEVEQDGIPLRVGDECRTRVPATIPIQGEVSLIPGATSRMEQVEYEIPSFTGCGVDEDLDPLLTGLVSGHGNLLDTELTVRCIGCPPGL